MHKKYLEYQAEYQGGCDFCKLHVGDGQVVQETPHLWIAKNRFPYSVWDGFGVIEHLMILPKRHIDSLASFTDAEAKEYFKVMSVYESHGYSVYSRAPDSAAKSMPHQHTHLIKLNKTPKKMAFYIRNPHINIHR